MYERGPRNYVVGAGLPGTLPTVLRLSAIDVAGYTTFAASELGRKRLRLELFTTTYLRAEEAAEKLCTRRESNTSQLMPIVFSIVYSPTKQAAEKVTQRRARLQPCHDGGRLTRASRAGCGYREVADREPLSHSSPKTGLEWGTQRLLPVRQNYDAPAALNTGPAGSHADSSAPEVRLSCSRQRWAP
jgi:hypothetical protein